MLLYYYYYIARRERRLRDLNLNRASRRRHPPTRASGVKEQQDQKSPPPTPPYTHPVTQSTLVQTTTIGFCRRADARIHSYVCKSSGLIIHKGNQNVVYKRDWRTGAYIYIYIMCTLIRADVPGIVENTRARLPRLQSRLAVFYIIPRPRIIRLDEWK